MLYGHHWNSWHLYNTCTIYAPTVHYLKFIQRTLILAVICWGDRPGWKERWWRGTGNTGYTCRHSGTLVSWLCWKGVPVSIVQIPFDVPQGWWFRYERDERDGYTPGVILVICDLGGSCFWHKGFPYFLLVFFWEMIIPL